MQEKVEQKGLAINEGKQHTYMHLTRNRMMGLNAQYCNFGIQH